MDPVAELKLSFSLLKLPSEYVPILCDHTYHQKFAKVFNCHVSKGMPTLDEARGQNLLEFELLIFESVNSQSLVIRACYQHILLPVYASHCQIVASESLEMA